MRAAARKRVRALSVLSRVKEREIDAVTADLRRLQDEVGRLRRDRQGLEEGLEENAQTETLEGSFFIARYARSVREQMSAIDRQVAELTPKLTALEDRMRELFVESKTYESLQARISVEEIRSRQRREADALEEAHLLRRARRVPLTGS